MKCSLCGYEFSPEVTCPRCPLAKGCHIVCCPHCGYQTVVESKIIKLLERIKSGGKLWLRQMISKKKS